MRSPWVEPIVSEANTAIELYLRRVEGRHPLPAAARQALYDLPRKRQTFDIYRDVVREGERTRRCCLVETGFVSRYKTLPTGGRQINSFHTAGDMVDLQSSLLLVADHSIRTHTPTTILTFDCQDVLRLAHEWPEWGRAFWFDTMVDSAIFREWMLNVGRRSAVSRVAHLMLELAWKFKAIGESDGKKFVLPVTQADLADAAGLSAVHTNRSMQKLREDGLIRTYGKTVVIEDEAALSRLASFNPLYLHPEGPRELA